MSVPLLALALTLAPAAVPQEAPRVPVLVELFTSEGCSSCPPADELLAQLLREQPIPGVQVIGLSEHVDYWDDLGWRDPFSSPAFTARQQVYAQRLSGGSVYTPQLVVAGEAAVVGSRGDEAQAAIRAAAADLRGQVSARLVPGQPGLLEVKAHWPGGAKAEVRVALIQAHATSKVARGENAGRTLEHAAVVRGLTTIGSGAGAYSGRVHLPATAGADRVVVLVQEREGGRVQCAAEVALEGW